MNFVIDERHPYTYLKQNHIVIDDFLNHEKAARVEEALQEIKINDKWYSYDNLFEKKLATDNMSIVPPQIRQMMFELNSQEFVTYLETMTGIDGLIPDPWLRGGGVHVIPNGGFLDIHADRTIHPKLKLYRRVNVLIYFNRGYDKKYGGQLELWNQDVTRCIKSIEPIYNRSVIFNTDGKSYHGHPNLWMCTKPRMSLAAYYFTSTIPEGFCGNMESTDFKSRPGDKPDPVKDKLREERRKLRING